MDAERAAGAWRFDRFTLDIARGALLGPDGVEVPLRPKSLALLRLLVENPGRLVDRDAIMEAVWPSVTVGDESITQCIRDIRKALGDEAQQLLKTVPKRGYLLAAEATPAESTAPTPRVERRLAAILAADIVGYSRLIEQDEAATLAAIKGLREQAIDPLLAEHKGRIVKLMGDGAIVEFASVVDAVACAVAVQKAVADRQAKTPADKRIVFRIGVNLGDVVVEGDDLMGDGVNIAARLEQLAEPGGVLVSGTAFDHLQGRLGMPLEFTGEQQVKNISRPVRAYRVRLDGTKTPVATAAKGRGRFVITAAVSLFAAVFLGGVWHFWPTEPPPAKPGIAILPFDSIGGDDTTSRLADGVTEDVITDLARFRNLDVIARNSTEVYRGKALDVREVGKSLGVGYVLEGSVQRENDQLRITAQLIDAGSGAHVWSQRWDRPSRDIFAVQTELAESVADRIGGYYSGSLITAGQEAARRKRPQDLSAYDLYLLGMQAKHRETQEGIEEAIGLLQRSLAIDPAFARAWTGLFWARNGLSGFVEETPEARKEREDAARRAVELDPEDAEARVALATVYGDAGDLAHAEAEFDRAMSLSPNSADLLAIYADWASSFGKPEAGVAALERSMRLNPNTPPWAYTNFRDAYFMAGRYDDALRMQDHLPRESWNRKDLVYGAATLGALGRAAEAQAAVQDTLARFPDVSAEWGAWWFGLSDGDYQRLLETMREAGFLPCSTSQGVENTPELKGLPECEAERGKEAAAAKAG